jgi:ABC-type nitrate/sulfonate/bicarbonate transport system permease component
MGAVRSGVFRHSGRFGVFLIALGAFFPIVVNTAAGVQ